MKPQKLKALKMKSTEIVSVRICDVGDFKEVKIRVSRWLRGIFHKVRLYLLISIFVGLMSYAIHAGTVNTIYEMMVALATSSHVSQHFTEKK